MEQSLGFTHFFEQTDLLGKGVLAVLFILSVASWYFILTKAITNILSRKRADAFLSRFWSSRSLQEMNSVIGDGPADSAFPGLVRQAFEVERHGLYKFGEAGGYSEYLTRVLRNGIDQEFARIESGLSVLASAGSAAPYIGLFGTVWAIYHALVNIGLSGQGTLDKVAGPVGEALIMTALGLAVAIPAVLAYNSFNRRNRIWMAKLDAFAHDLYVLLSVGEKAIQKTEKDRTVREAVSG